MRILDNDRGCAPSPALAHEALARYQEAALAL